jgi:hypothetical protein
MDGRVQLPLIRYLPKRFNVDYVDSITEVGHHDCAGNPAPKNDQIVHLQKAIQSIRQQYENIEVIGLWVDKNWEVHEID